MKSGRKSFLDDPALAIMGLVPARGALVAGADEGRASVASWRAAWVAFALGFALIIALFWSTASQIVTIWYYSATFNHGFLILPICGYLVWLKRGLIACLTPQPSLWGIGAIVLAGVGWLFGYAGSVSMVQQFALVVVIQGLILSVFGWAIVRALVFPLAYLFFAVPFGQFMIAPLQDLTAVFVVKGLQIVGIPVFLDGIFISIPTGNFEVAEACAGVRFLIATVALGTLFAHITYRSYRRQLAFLSLSFVVPVIANGFRAFGIVLLAYYSNNEIAVGVDHIVYGWVFFSAITVILLVCGMAFRDDGMKEVEPDAVYIAGGPAVAQRRIGLIALLAVLAGAIAPAYAGRISARAVPDAPRALPVPVVADGWQESDSGDGRWSPVYPSAHASLMQRYVKGNQRVDLYVAYYTSQRHGAEVIHIRNTVAGSRWGRASSGKVTVDISGDRETVERSRLIYRGRENRIVYKWYWVGGYFTANPYVAKVYQAIGQLLTGQEAAASIVVSAAYDEVPGDADHALREFLKNLRPVAPLLQRVSENR